MEQDTPTQRAANVLRDVADDQRLSIADVARRAGHGYESTRRKLTGVGPITLDEFAAYCTILELDPADVIRAAIPTPVDDLT